MKRKMTPRMHAAALLVVALVAVIGATACGSSSNTTATNATTPTSGATGSTIVAPQSVKSRGYLAVESTDDYPPFGFVTNGKWGGVDFDLMNAIAQKLGVQAHFYANANFTAMIPSVQNHRYDILVGGFADTPVRRQVVDFFDVYKGVNHLIVKAGNPLHVHAGHLCGLTVIVAQGTEEEGLAQQLAAQCKKTGKPMKLLDISEAGAGVYVAVQNGRAAVTLDNAAHGAYVVKQSSGLEVLPDTVGPALSSGWIIAKGNTQLRTAIEQAITELIKDGTWQSILSKWGVTSGTYLPPLFDGQPFSSSAP